MTKTMDEYFRDWEGTTFGFGYGTGENHIIPVIKRFFELIPMYGCYDYQVLEKELTPAVAWLLINIFCQESILEYGTSPRGAWLDTTGKKLKSYIDSKTIDDLYVAITRDQVYTRCYPSACNCGEGYVEGVKCANPFWHERFGRG